jgi:isocitrate dehydrogenase kinase/phosphatase
MNVEDNADLAAKLTLEAFDSFNAAFRAITCRAKQKFEEKDWAGGRRNATERLDLYDRVLESVAGQLALTFEDRVREPTLWVSAKQHFAILVARRYDIDRAETFFNSVTRKILKTQGINREVEFFYLHPKVSKFQPGDMVYCRYTRETTTRALVKNILEDFKFNPNYEDLDRDTDLIAREMDLYLWPVIGMNQVYSVDIVKAVFYRNKEAYIVGRIVANARTIPLIIPLINGEKGIYADTVLLHEAEASIVFSFAYSYFQVDLERYDVLIEFLHSIIPHAPLAELYTSLGYNRHGKTEFYRDLHRFVHVSREQFVIAPGLEGAVMIAFTLPSYNFVFKVIKDRPCFLRSRIDTLKVITREQVRFRYNFVSHHDRAGRMVDTQEFENLRFRKKRFSAMLLEEFKVAGRNNVTITADYVIIKHVYVQRKVVPLPMYFESEKNPEALRQVLIDFGYFLKDLAASGVFPSDLFNIWNYGITHWGRVVLFDYDDVLPIEHITFREKPKPRDEIEEIEPEENWILAGEDEFFIDEIDRYSGIPEPLKGVFKSVHGDLYTLKFWQLLTEKLNQGEIFDVIPYDRSKRFSGREG